LITILVVLGAIVVLPALFMGFGMMGYGPMMGGMWGGRMWGDGGVPGWMVLVGALSQLLVLAAVVGAGYLVYRAVTRSEEPERAIEELRVAYARGDLDDEEYERRREVLEREE
jgi:putative membrane protein